MQIDLFGGPPASGPIGAVDEWAFASERVPAMGVDEAGRGPLAGPVFAAAVVLPHPLPPCLASLDDSKRLTHRARCALEPLVMQSALAYGVARADAAEIDQVNILEATRSAMRRAIEAATEQLGRAPATLFVDGHLPLPNYAGEQWPLVKGDGRSWCVAAASVLAKVQRDRWMVMLDEQYPGYGFAGHKGYGTKAHRRALVALGPSPVHRQSFRWSPPDEESG